MEEKAEKKYKNGIMGRNVLKYCPLHVICPFNLVLRIAVVACTGTAQDWVSAFSMSLIHI